MSENNRERKGGLNKRIVLFFVFAIACIAAFLIVLLVKTCEADHEEKMEEEAIEQQFGMNQSSEDILMLA